MLAFDVVVARISLKTSEDLSHEGFRTAPSARLHAY